MEVCQSLTIPASSYCPAIETLQHRLSLLRQSCQELHWEDYENELHNLMTLAEQEILSEDLQKLDVNEPSIEVKGTVYRRVAQNYQTYQSAAGPVRAKRTLYRSSPGSKCIVPLELQAGVVEGFWLPRAAKQAAWMVAQLPPTEASSLLELLGNMKPSASTLARLPAKLSERWEQYLEPFEYILADNFQVPANAVTVAASLDGVMLPMKDGKRQEKRDKGAAEGKRTRGPAGCQEASCGTLSFYDDLGNRLSTIRMGRMPESKKETLKQSIKNHLNKVLEQKPDLTLVKVADGAKDNWTYLSSELPEGHEIIDFYHAAEHLKKAFDLSYGENSSKAKEKFKTYRHILKEEPGGIDKVIRALAYQHKKHPRRSKLKTELEYFRKNSSRMKYAEHLSKSLPIGSGVIEAACKTLVAQRMKCSGMRWRNPGGQGILTLRSLIQSDWFDNGWRLLSFTYRARISDPNDNVIPFPNKVEP